MVIVPEKIFFIICIIMILLCIFVSCDDVDRHEYLKMGQEVIVAVNLNDEEAFCSLVELEDSDIPVSNQFALYKNMLADFDYFRLSLVSFSSSEKDGVTICEGTFGLYTKNGNYIVTASHRSDIDKFTLFDIEPDTNNQLPEMDNLPWN